MKTNIIIIVAAYHSHIPHILLNKVDGKYIGTTFLNHKSNGFNCGGLNIPSTTDYTYANPEIFNFVIGKQGDNYEVYFYNAKGQGKLTW